MRNWFRGLKLNQKFTVTTLIFIFIPLFWHDVLWVWGMQKECHRLWGK